MIVNPWTGKAWKPQNFEKDEFDGRILLRKALAESKNTVAVKLLLDVGLDKVRAEAKAAGLSSEIPAELTAALGTGEVGVLELLNAYATLASQGRRADAASIRKVLSRDGNVLFAADPKVEETVKPEVAYVVSDMLRSVIEDPSGTAHSLSALGRPAAGKTGTASEHRDAWFIGFTPSLIAGGWVGFDTHEMMGPAETGGHAAGPMWLQWMRAATAGTVAEEWPAPPREWCRRRSTGTRGASRAPEIRTPWRKSSWREASRRRRAGTSGRPVRKTGTRTLDEGRAAGVADVLEAP